MRGVLAALAAALFAVVLSAPGVGSIPALDRDEARYAQATRQMLESGDFVDIRFQDRPRYKKPIGIHWLQSAAVAVAGFERRNEIGVYRLPSLVGAVVAVVATALTGAILFSPAVGLLGGLFLASSLLLGVQARLATTDAVLLATIVSAQAALAAMYARDRGVSGGDSSWSLLFWVALGVGVLIKGPVAPIVCATTLLALLVTDGDRSWLGRLRLRPGVWVAAAIVLPWLVAIAWRSKGAFFTAAIGDDVLGKVTTGQQRHGAPPGFHLALWPILFWPYSLVALLALPSIRGRRREPPVRFCLAWIVPTWLLFELVATKLPHYVLPTYPAVALLAAAALVQGELRREGWPWRLATGLWGLVTLAVIASPLAAPAVLDGRFDGRGLIAALAVAASAGVFLVALRRGRWIAAVAVMTAGLGVFDALVFGSVLPRLEAPWVSRNVARLRDERAPCSDATVAAVGFHEPSLVFQLGTETKLVGLPLAARHLAEDRGCALALVPRGDAAELRRELERIGATAREIGRVEGFDYTSGRAVALGLYAAGVDSPRWGFKNPPPRPTEPK